jgi:hypothetical protein
MDRVWAEARRQRIPVRSAIFHGGLAVEYCRESSWLGIRIEAAVGDRRGTAYCIRDQGYGGDIELKS